MKITDLQTQKINKLDKKIENAHQKKEIIVKSIKKYELNRDDLKKQHTISSEEMEQLRIQGNKLDAELALIEQQINSLNLEKQLITKGYFSLKRLIIGAGVAGTALFAELPLADGQEELSVLVINDPENNSQWMKDGRSVMGQTAKVQSPQIFSRRSEDFNTNAVSLRNPYNYVMSDDFYLAMVTTQHEMGMKILNAVALKIDSNPQQPTEWYQHQHRVTIQLNDNLYYIYVDHIDICAGPGVTRKFAAAQIDPQVAEKLAKKQQLIYGQDTRHPVLKGDVVFYGGGGRNASMILDILNNYQTGVKSFQWIARTGDDFDAITTFNRLFSDLDANASDYMATGDLLKIEETTQGQLKLTFGKSGQPRQIRSAKEAPSSILCDHLVVSIGQEQQELTKQLKDFIPCILKSSLPDGKVLDNIPLGTYSKDGSIMIWGAAGALGIGLGNNKEFNTALAAHALTMPLESRGPTGIYRSIFCIRKMVSELRQQYPDKFKNKEQSNHRFDLPDINQATCGELYELFELVNPSNDSLKLAEKVLEVRKKEPEGLLDLEKLSTILPLPLLTALSKNYFPTENPSQASLADSSFTLWAKSKSSKNSPSMETATILNSFQKTN